MTTQKVISVLLQALTGTFRNDMRAAARETTGFGQTVRSTGQTTSQMSRQMDGAARSTGLLTGSVGRLAAGYLGVQGLKRGLDATVGSAIKWESAWAGVTKTVEGTPSQLASIEHGLRRMSTEIPTSAEGLAGIAESAGQLGIQTPNVLGFTRVIADLGETTNLTGERGAVALARLANITGMSQDNFDRLGSTVVALGNNLATTEAEIVEMGLRIAGAGRQVGLTEAQILSLAGAMSSVGVEAEAGGTAISRVMVEIANSVASADDRLGLFAEVAGMSAQQFATAWRDNAAGALVAFIGGLGDLGAAGQNLFPILDELEVGEIRVRDALLRTSGAQDVLVEALELGNDAWRENIALQEEAAKRYATTESQLRTSGNRFAELGRNIGRNLSGPLGAVADGAADTAEALSRLPRWATVALGPLGALAGMAADTADNTHDLNAEMRDGIDAIRRFDATIADAVDATRAEQRALIELEDQAEDTTADLEQLSDAVDRLFGANLSVAESTLRWEDALHGLKDDIDESGTSLDLHSEKGRDNRRAMLDALDSAIRLSEAIGEQTGSAQAAAGALEGMVGRLRDQAIEAGFSEEAIDSLLAEVGLIPGQIRTSLDEAVDTATEARDGFVAAGKAAGSGFVEGLDSTIIAASRKAAEMADAARRAAEVRLQIRSPSRVFHTIGVDTARGFIEGLEDQAFSVEQAVTDLVEQAVGGARDIVSSIRAAMSRDAAQARVGQIESELASLRGASGMFGDDLAVLDQAITAERARAHQIDPSEQLRILRAELDIADAEERLAEIRADETTSVTELKIAELELAEARAELTRIRQEATSDDQRVIELLRRRRDLFDEQAERTERIRHLEEQLTDAKLAAIAAEQGLFDAGQDLLDQSPAAVKMFEELATAAGLTRSEVDHLVASYLALQAAAQGRQASLGGTVGAARDAQIADALRTLGIRFGQRVDDADLRAAFRHPAVGHDPGEVIDPEDLAILLARARRMHTGGIIGDPPGLQIGRGEELIVGQVGERVTTPSQDRRFDQMVRELARPIHVDVYVGGEKLDGHIDVRIANAFGGLASAVRSA